MRGASAASPVTIGVLLPTSGGLDDHARQMRLGVTTAVADLNESGGVLGRPLRLAFRDSEGSPRNLADRCAELVRDEGAQAVVGPFIAFGRKVAARALAPSRVPLLTASNNEGGFCGSGAFTLAPTPYQDSYPLLQHLDGGRGRSYFLVGSASSWQISMFRRTVLRILYHHGGNMLGEALTKVGETNFEPVARWVAATDADVVVLCVPRRQGSEFVRQAHAIGLLDRVDLGWIGFNEMHAQDLGGDLAKMVVTASSFVAGDPANGVPALVSRMRTHADETTPITYYAFSHYTAVAALASAWEAAGEASGEAAMNSLPNTALEAATGPISFDAASRQAKLPMVIAKGADDGSLEIVERSGVVEPGPGCQT
jgi:ABC-type branched-subunit amino acid transport system substrate-binding protein